MDEQTRREIRDAVQEAFSTSTSDGRYIDVSRVPLICQSIIGIDSKLDDMRADMVTQDQFWPVKTIVYGLVGLILVAVVGALLVLVVKS